MPESEDEELSKSSKSETTGTHPQEHQGERLSKKRAILQGLVNHDCCSRKVYREVHM